MGQMRFKEMIIVPNKRASLSAILRGRLENRPHNSFAGAISLKSWIFSKISFLTLQFELNLSSRRTQEVVSPTSDALQHHIWDHEPASCPHVSRIQLIPLLKNRLIYHIASCLLLSTKSCIECFPEFPNSFPVLISLEQKNNFSLRKAKLYRLSLNMNPMLQVLFLLPATPVNSDGGTCTPISSPLPCHEEVSHI